MKKFSKLFLIVFSFSIGMLSAMFVNFFVPKNFNATANYETSANYIISNSLINGNNFIKLSLVNSNNSEIIRDNLSTFDDVFDQIDANLAENSKSILNTKIFIYFDNFVFYENWKINLTEGNFVFSGNITNPLSTTTFEIKSLNDNYFSFVDIIISASSQNIIEVKYSNTKTNIFLQNSSFESLISNSYAFKFENTSCDFTLSKINYHTTSYLFNYQLNINVLFDNFLQSDFKVSLPSNLNNQPILNNITEVITASFTFYPENNVFSIEAKSHWTTKKLIYTSLIKLNSNLNGGFSRDAINENFAYGQHYELPSTLTKTENYFAGWFGSCIIDSTTYFFDSQMLKLAKEQNYNKEFIKSTFTTSLNNVSNNNSFVEFFSETNDQNFVDSQNFVSFFENINQIPTITAKWEYEIILNLGEETKSIKTSIDSLPAIDNPIKLGYSFDGWFNDKDCTSACNFNEIRTNTTIYAKWKVNQYQITFIANNEQLSTAIESFDFDETIQFPSFTKVGHSIIGWKTTDESIFESENMPAYNITLFAVWGKNTYSTFFESDGNEYFQPVKSKYLDAITKPNDPTKTGYSFVAWVDKDTNLLFDFSTTPAKNSIAVATWSKNSYLATFNFTDIADKSIEFGESINVVPIKRGYQFLGWFDSNNERIETMPAEDINLYPKWLAKQVLTLSLESQSQSIGSDNMGYKITSITNNFNIEYFVDGVWTSNVPSSKGIYDVRISRAEDNNYAEFNQIILNGYEVLPKFVSLDIAIVSMLALFFIEIVSIIAIKWIRNQKRHAPVLYSVILPFAMFDTNEFILASVAFLFVIIGLIWLIYELVVLHKTIPDPSIENKYDNRLTISKIEDSSNDIDIEQKVEDILVKNNLIKPKYKKKNFIKINTDDNDVDYLDIYNDKN